LPAALVLPILSSYRTMLFGGMKVVVARAVVRFF